MKSQFGRISIAAFGLLLLGCAPGTYLQNTPNVSLLEAQGEVAVQAYASVNRGQLQGAYAITDHAAVQANVMQGWSLLRFDKAGEYQATLLEAGVGYYGKLNRWLYAESFAGFGMGRSGGRIRELLEGSYNFSYRAATIEYDTDFRKYYLEGALAYRHAEHSVGLALRSAYVQFDQYDYVERISGYETGSGSTYPYVQDSIRSANVTGVVLDPTIFFRTELGPLLFKFQAGWSFAAFQGIVQEDPNQNEYFVDRSEFSNDHPTYMRPNVSLGLVLRLPARIKQRPAQSAP